MGKALSKIHNYAIIDFESGGLSCKENPITEFAGVGINGTTLGHIVRYDNLVKPYDDKLIYGEIAAKITGITKAMCEKDGVPLKDLVKDICQFFDEVNAGVGKNFKCIVVAHNFPFDIPFLIDIFNRTETDLSNYVSGYVDPYGNFQPMCLDTIVLCKQAWAEETDASTKFNLGECCRMAGIELVDSHRALQDTVSTAELFVYAMRRIRSKGMIEKEVVEAAVNHRHKFEW